ncbi:MAG: hypothetical protein R6V47_08140 [Candidatus Delongbacteria bacterium]
MRSGNKIFGIFVSVAVVLLASGYFELEAQTNEDKTRIEGRSFNDVENIDEEEFDKETGNTIEKPKKRSASSAVEEKNDRRAKIMLERELKRHENEMKKIKLMRSRAREKLKECEELEKKELERHDISVRKIKGKK